MLARALAPALPQICGEFGHIPGPPSTRTLRGVVNPAHDSPPGRSPSTPTRRAFSSFPPWRRLPTGISSWCGRATARPGRTRSGSSIQGQRYASDGSAQGAQFQVNTYTTSDQTVSLRGGGCRRGLRRGVARATARPGRTRASAASRASATPRTDRRRARSSRSTPTRRATRRIPPWRRLPTGTSSWCGRATARPGRTRAAAASRASATPRTDRPRVRSSRSTPTRRATSSHPSVAADADGDFVVVWTSDGSFGTDTSYCSIQGQRYASDGSAQGAQFQVNTYTTSDQDASLRGGGCRRGLRRGVGELRLVRDGHERPAASRASATPRTDRPRARSSRSTPTPRTTRPPPPCRRLPTGTSSLCGTVPARSERTRASYSIQGQRYACRIRRPSPRCIRRWGSRSARRSCCWEPSSRCQFR